MDTDNFPTTDPPANPKPKRRWYQFSLRALLIFVTLCAVACSWFAVKMEQARKRGEAVVEILAMGGSVTYDYNTPSSGGSAPKAQPPGPQWLRDFLGIDFFSDVTAVRYPNEVKVNFLPKTENLTVDSFINKDTVDAGLKDIKRFTKLRQLSLCGANINNSTLEAIKGMTQLRELNLANSLISDFGLEEIRGLDQLRKTRSLGYGN